MKKIYVNTIIILAGIYLGGSVFAKMEITPQTISGYFSAAFEEREGKHAQAEEQYKMLISSSRAPEYMYKGYVRHLRKTRQFHEILKMRELLDRLFPDDPLVQLAIIEALDRTHAQKQAIERAIRLNKKYPDHQELALLAAQIYFNQGEPENAIRVIDEFLANSPKKPNNFMFYFLKAQILLHLNKKEEARTALKNCINAYRNFEKGWLLYALLEEQLGNLDEAIKGYTTFLDIAGNDQTIQNHLLQLLFKQKIQNGETTSITFSIPCLQKALLLFEQNKLDDALKQVEECLRQQPKNTDAQVLKIQILGMLGEQRHAISLLKEWMLAEPENELWFQTACLLLKRNLKKRDLIAALQAVEKRHPKAILPLKYLADIYLRTNNNSQALHYLKKITIVSTNAQLKAKAYYQMARIYHQQQNNASMLQALENGYAHDKTFAPICNMIAYHYAGKGNNLAKAEELVKQSLVNDAHNPHYLDTAGYLAYKQGDYSKALSIIEPLACTAPHDAIISKHIRKINVALAQQKANRQK